MEFLMIPLARPPKDDTGPGCGCLVAIVGGLLLWAGWTVLAFVLGRMSGQ
jgi:hypothetical protein